MTPSLFLTKANSLSEFYGFVFLKARFGCAAFVVYGLLRLSRWGLVNWEGPVPIDSDELEYSLHTPPSCV